MNKYYEKSKSITNTFDKNKPLLKIFHIIFQTISIQIVKYEKLVYTTTGRNQSKLSKRSSEKHEGFIHNLFEKVDRTHLEYL